MKKIDTFQAFARGAKSLVAILLVMLMAVGNLFADQVTFIFSEQEYTNNQEMIALSPIAIDNNVNVSFSKGTGSTTPKYLTNGTAVRAYGGNTMTIAAAQNVEISSVNIIFGSSDGTNAISVDNGTYADSSWSGNANTIVFTIGGTSGHRRIAGLTVTYTVPSTPVTVAAPAFTPAAGTYTAVQSVTLATTTEGATIYYTVDGTEPTAESLIYQGAISVNENMTIKAIAILGEDQSTVATANYVINLPLTVTNIAAFKALDINEVATITGDVVVLGQYPNYLFVQDATGALVIYGSTSYNYNAGDVISGGINGKRAVYNGMNQMSNPGSFTAGVAGTPVEPVVVSAADLIANYVTYESKLVTIENVELAANHTFTASGADRGVDVTQGESTITVYDQFKVVTGETVSAGAKTVTGYLAIYVNNNTTRYEIFPRGAEDITDYVAPIQPLDLDSIATLPYTYNFDDGEDPYFMINNGEATNAWYKGQAQGFDNNKLYISSNHGLTNKYDVTKASNVMAYRTVMVPETGAILSFDYRVNGQANNDYLKVNLVKGETITEIATLQGENEWASFHYDISGEMAGEVCIQFNWVNNASAGNQFPAAIDNISVIETPCSQPTVLTATVDSTTAVITWQAVEGQTAWNLQYKLANHTEWYTVAATDTTVTLTDLQGNSNYEMRVQAVCGENVSAWTNGVFAVDCQNGEITTTVEDVEIGTYTTTNSYLPFYGTYNYSYSQQIIDAAEINAGAGNIYSVSFDCNSAPASTSTGNIRIWMANTTKSVFDNNTDYIDPSTLTLVYTGPSSYAYQVGLNTFIFDTPFEYDGGNVVVAYYEGNSSWNGGSFRVHSTNDVHKSIMHYSDSQSDVSYENPASASGSKQFPLYRDHMVLNMDVTVGYCDDVVACPDPSNLSVDTVTASSAVLTWTAGSADETAFIVEYQAEGATEWTSVDVNDTTYTLTELAQLTNYSVRVKANCGTNNWSNMITNSFRTIGVCPPVTNLETANVSNTTTLTWTVGGSEIDWLVQFKPATAGDDEWTSINVNTIPMTTFGGLQGNTDYEVRVQALCDPNDTENQSEWTSTTFHSGCAAFEVPFTEEFPTNTMPTCWENQGFLFASSGYAYTNTNGAELISPAINIPAENSTYLTFEVRGSGNYTVLASYRGTRADRFAEIYTGTAPNQNTVVTIALDDLYKGRAVNFKIVNNSTNYQYFYYVKVNQCPFVATDLTTSNITGTTIDLAWEADEAVNNFQVQYGEHGFTLGEGTNIDVLNAAEVTVTGLNYETEYDFYVSASCGGGNISEWAGPVTATTAPSCSAPTNLRFDEQVTNMLLWNAGVWGTPAQYNVRYRAEGETEYTTIVVEPIAANDQFIVLEGLLSNTTYEVGVQSVCGENQESDWAETSMTTPCVAYSLPYTEDFESYTATSSYSTLTGGVMPDCWSNNWAATPSSSSNYCPKVTSTTTYNPNGSGKFLVFMASSNSYSYYQNNTVVTLPAFDVDLTTAMISFKARANSTATGRTLSFGYVDNAGDFTELTTVTPVTTTGAPLQTILLSSYTFPTDARLAFKANITASSANYYVGIDDIEVKLIPTCFTPSIAVSGTNATITPNANGATPGSYDLQIGNEIVNVTGTTADLWSLFTLELSTPYEVMVRANCGGSETSEWSEPVSFTTPVCAGGVSVDLEGTGTNSNLPTYTYYNYSYTQQIYKAEEIGATNGGQISSISFEKKSGSTNPTRNLTVYLMHTNATSFTTGTTSWLDITSATEVYSGSVTFNTGWNEINFTTPFNYNGTDNLAIIVDDNTGSYVSSPSFGVHTTPASMAIRVYSDGTNYDPFNPSSYSGTALTSRNNIKFDVCPAPSCGTPNITISGVTATITPSANGTPVSYDLQIGEQTVNVTTTTVNLMDLFNLSFNENYEISIRANCDDSESSNWSIPVAFTTPACADPCIYTVAMEDGYGDGWTGNEINVLFNGSVVETLTIDNGSSNTVTLSFCDGNISFEWSEGNYPDEASFTIQDGTGATVYTCTDGSELTDGQVIYSAVCGTVPTCFVPSAVTVSGVTDQTAIVNWTDDFDQANYAVEYMAEGDATWTSVSVDTTYALLNNLQASTNYTVRVKAVCGTDDESDYTSEVEFTTACTSGVEVVLADPSSTTTTYYLPIDNFYKYSYTQQIVDAEELTGVSAIGLISFEYGYESPMTKKNNVKIYLGTTDKSVFESTTDWVTTGLQEVYSGALNCSQGWNEFVLNTPYSYAGGNLVVVIEDMSNDYDGNSYIFKSTSTSGYKSMYYHSDSNPFSGSNSASGRAQYRANMKLVSCPEATDLAITSINDFNDACDVDGAVTIGVRNLGYEGTINTFEAYYQVNDGTPVHETATLATPIAFNETAEYTFNQLPAFTASENIITAWVELTGDLVAGNNTKVSAPITVLDPIAVPYVEEFTGLTINHGWNPIDANNDGITMGLNNNINYSFNDEAAADDWMMSPCIEMAAGNYTITYDYKANSSLTESFEVFYGNGAHVTDMTNTVATHTFNNTTYETVTTTITIPADGIYNFGFHATSLAGNLGFTIDNFKVYPVNDVIVTFNENGGTVTPNGTVAVNYGEDLTLNLLPDLMYHVAGVWVDDVQVVPEDGTGANFMLYTLENVTEPHTVYVDFKLEFHIFKTVENYRADLYSDLGGAFVPSAIDTTLEPAPFTLNMVADPHYHLYSLDLAYADPDHVGSWNDVTAGVVNNGDGTYTYITDSLNVANYTYKATFRRDTVAINYNVLNGKGYANDSELLDATDINNNTYTTWVDYSVNHDVDTTVTFEAGDNYHIVDVIVNGESRGRIDSYTFEDVTTAQNVDLKFGYMITTSVRNFNTYDDIQEPQGTLVPDTQYVAEYNPMMVVGSVNEHFHLYQLLVNNEDRIDEVVFGNDPHYYMFMMDSVDNNYTIEAVVKVDTFAITYIVANGQGTIDGSDLLVAPDTLTHYHNYGDDWYSNIVPATGYSIANVDLDGQNLYTANNYQFNYIESDHLFTVNFEANTYTITTNAYGEGTVSDGMTFTYDPENPVNYELNAFAAEGYHIASVVINNAEIEVTDPQTFAYTIENVADNYLINVYFAINTYTMEAEAGSNGTITPDGTQIVNYGTNMSYTITANTGWYIASTVIDGVTTTYTQADDLTTLTVPFTEINANHSVSATFAQYIYTITGTVNANGTINGETTLNEEVEYGSNYTVNFIPADNYHITDVLIDGVSVGAVDYYEFINITENHNVAVIFDATMYTLTATSNIAACSITPAVTTVQAGSNVAYTLTAANGYHLENVIANGEEVVVTNNAFTISDVQSDYTIYANFAPNYVTVTVNQPAHATITPGTQTYAYGATPSYMIIPETGYEVVSVTAGNAVVTVTYNNGIGTFTLAALQQDITLTATTSIKKYEITVTQGANGTIAPGTQTNVEYGTNKTFTITPNDYYVVADVIVDGSSRGALSSYTFYNVTGNHTITAVFEANCQTPTNLTAMNIDTTSALLTWMGTAPSYEVRYKAFDSGIYMNQTVTTTSLQLTDLLPGTMYEYGVRAICGADLTSDWATNVFTTRALPVGPVDGISNVDMSSIKVYSFQNNVYIVNEEGIAISNVDIYDIYGKQVYTGKVLSSPEVISLSVANGNYVVRLATENGVGVYKVAIVR